MKTLGFGDLSLPIHSTDFIQGGSLVTGTRLKKNVQKTWRLVERKTQTGADLDPQNATKWGWYILAFYACSWLSRERCKIHTLLPKMLTYLVTFFIAVCLRSWLHTTFQMLWTHVFELNLWSVSWTWLSASLLCPQTPNWLTLYSGVSLLTVWLSAQESHSFSAILRYKQITKARSDCLT